MTTHPHRRVGASGAPQLVTALMITSAVMVVELVAGMLSGSLALLADAGHMLTDAFALGLSLFAAWITTKPATPEKTYGYYRTEILAALANCIILWLFVIGIALSAAARFRHPPTVLAGPMLIAAWIGLVANVASGVILFGARTDNLNTRSAWLHVLSDGIGSCGVIAAGLLIRLKGWVVADPVVSVFIGVLIAVNSWALVTQSINILLEGTPAHLDIRRIIQTMRQVQGVREVHDLHLWTITTGMEAMSGHILVEELSHGSTILQELNRVLSDQFGITHTTFQLEPQHHRCDLGEPAER